jgi:FkbM family methyltransferase
VWENRDEKQYEYHNGDVDFDVRKGDIVIDGGACFGDNALEFAKKAGKNGKVFSFEFDPKIIEIFNMNLKLNSEISERIEIIQKVLWENSNHNISVNIESSIGASFVEHPSYSSQEVNDTSLLIKSISIDEFIKQKKLPKVDFIKLDIEGSELECLKGAKETIKKFKPRIAVCVYHKDDDLINIPTYLKELVPNYSLYLKQNLDDITETVLYAIVND